MGMELNNHNSFRDIHPKNFGKTLDKTRNTLINHGRNLSDKGRKFYQEKKQKHGIKKIILSGVLVIVLLLGIFMIWIATLKIPDISSFHDRKIVNSTQILDRTGEINLYDIHENIQRKIIPSEAISYRAKQAIIAIEDINFYQHHGIRISSIIRASLSQVIPGLKQSGGSTITQQLIKNTILSRERSVTRKIKEWVLAVKLEQQLTKDEILTLYLNEAPYGGTIYGISEASRVFFNKKAINLTTAEAAYLAAIPNAPTYYSPYTEKGKTRLETRKNLVLKKMLETGVISQSDYDSAKNEIIIFQKMSDAGGKSMHFVEYIINYLEKKYGPDILTTAGLRVTTTLDYDLQTIAEQTIHENALKNEKEWNASNSALVAIDPKTGQILSMVGSRDYFDTKIDGQFNVVTASRQPGSSFKPLVYTKAFEMGYEPETVLMDAPTVFSGDCAVGNSSPDCYAPENYDGKFVGPVSLRNALAQSRNIPAVKLLYLVGVQRVIDAAKDWGITTLDKNGDRYGLTLVLGGGETSLLELTSVYSIFANDGVRNTSTGILKVEDADGKILEEYKPNPEPVINPKAVRRTSSILSDNVARSPLFGPASFLYFGDTQVAGKTGTTNDNKDAWLIGYTPTIAVGVWSGNNDNKPMKKGSAISGPAWSAFMKAAIEKNGTENFIPYGRVANYESLPPVIRGNWQGNDSFTIDSVSGGLATEYTPEETRVEKIIPNPQSILYWIDKNNPTIKQTNPQSDGQLPRWQLGFQAWVRSHPEKITGVPIRPSYFDSIHRPELAPLLSVTINPDQGLYTTNDEINLQIVTGMKTNPLQKITISYHGRILETLSPTQSNFTFVADHYGINTGNQTIDITLYDNVFNKTTVSKDFIFN